MSNPRDEKLASKVKVRPVLMKDTRVYQMETFRGNQAFHETLSADEVCEKMLEAMENMKQMQLVTADAEFSVLISKKGKLTIKKKQKKAKMRPLDLNHNRKNETELHSRQKFSAAERLSDSTHSSTQDPRKNSSCGSLSQAE